MLIDHNQRTGVRTLQRRDVSGGEHPLPCRRFAIPTTSERRSGAAGGATVVFRARGISIGRCWRSRRRRYEHDRCRPCKEIDRWKRVRDRVSATESALRSPAPGEPGSPCMGSPHRAAQPRLSRSGDFLCNRGAAHALMLQCSASRLQTTRHAVSNGPLPITSHLKDVSCLSNPISLDAHSHLRNPE